MAELEERHDRMKRTNALIRREDRAGLAAYEMTNSSADSRSSFWPRGMLLIFGKENERSTIHPGDVEGRSNESARARQPILPARLTFAGFLELRRQLKWALY